MLQEIDQNHIHTVGQLTVSNNLAKLLGGVISVSSTYGKGTEFKLSLPRHDNKGED